LESERFDAIDVIKTAAIVAVVLTHSVLSSSMELHSSWDRLLGRGWVSFHVPSFLAVSGFLYCSRTAVAWRTVLERLGRVLVPYGVASIVALVLGDVPPRGPGFLERLVTGNTQGHYYYVVLIAVYIPFVWPMSRMRKGWISAILLVLLAYPLLSYHVHELRFSESQLARMRNPIYMGVYFVGGWGLRLALPRIRGLAGSWGRARFWLGLTLTGGVLVAFSFFGPLGMRPWQAQLADRMIYTAGVLILLTSLSAALAAMSSPARFPPHWVRFVSRATYTIYLYHFFFIYPMRDFTLHWAPPARILAVAGVALAGGCGVAYLSQRLMGRGAKWIVG
jgi:surface polysaccharide O-acyltransferase-like enzyme